MKLFNTRSQRIDEFRPKNDPITLYACGITPYDTTHLGHAFTYSAVDVLIRYLKSQDYKVNYVQNVTDIDDDILNKAAKEEKDWRELGKEWTLHFIRDMQSLNIIAPDHYPFASEMIPQIIEMVQTLLEKQLAYERAGSVYFSVERWPAYGDLSRIAPGRMLTLANQHGNHPADPNKHNPIDFVLWQNQGNEEPAWESPWGMGRPGWHIECSAMARHFLGDQVDIHAGGADLLFPHHESETVQSEAVTDQRPFVHSWMHVAMVGYQGEKMSKSLGNLVLVRDLLEDYTPDVVRLHLAKHHYRESWEYQASEMQASAEQMEHLLAALTPVDGHGEPLDAELNRLAFAQALDDDLNTPQALAVLFLSAGQITGAAGQERPVNDAQELLRSLASVLGFRLDSEATHSSVLAGWNRHARRIEERE